MSSIELRNVHLDYIINNGSNSIKKAALHCFTRFKSSSKQALMKHITYKALNDISLKLNLGDRVGLLGRNGAGKSTLLRVLANIYKPTQGFIETRGKIASLFDVNAGMNFDSTGYENVINLAIMRGISRKNFENIIRDVEEFTELGDFLNNPVRIYSAGMQMKLAFAVATSIPSEIILIDEIIGVGDAHFMEKATTRLMNIIDKSHILVLSSHSSNIIQRFCNKIIVLDQGKIQFFGDVESGIEFYTLC
ncbi:TPA: ABC transporter ATP-binding protein [Legionella anisa]